MPITAETRFLDVAGKKTQLTVGGSGPPLLYLHSAAGEADWLPFHEVLAENHTVYVPAHPGFVLSEGLDQIQDMQDLVWHYVDLLKMLGLANVPVAGFSLGAWLAMELAVIRPEMISRLVLADAAGIRLPDAPMAELFIDDLQNTKKLLFFNAECEGVSWVVPDSYEDTRMLMWLRAREATARVGWNPYLHNPRLPGHLHRIGCPTLVLWGREDRLIPLAHGEYLAEHLPHAKLVTFENCGHMLPFERPREFAVATRDFLAADLTGNEAVS